MVTNETLDRGVLRELRLAGAGAPDFLAMLLGQFLDEGEAGVARLREAAAQQDARALKAAAHSLKGASLTIGAMRFGGLCGRLEKDSAFEPGNAVAQLMREADEEFIRLKAACVVEMESARV